MEAQTITIEVASLEWNWEAGDDQLGWCIVSRRVAAGSLFI